MKEFKKLFLNYTRENFIKFLKKFFKFSNFLKPLKKIKLRKKLLGLRFKLMNASPVL